MKNKTKKAKNNNNINNSKGKHTQRNEQKDKAILMESTSLVCNKKPAVGYRREHKQKIPSPPPPQVAENSIIAVSTIIEDDIPPPIVIKMDYLNVEPTTATTGRDEVEDDLLEPVTVNTAIYEPQTKRKSRLRRFRHFVGKRIFSCLKPQT